ncbi:hypothetical protein EON63_24620 [archaeon]|nr:MAG: hypothetical protein EON63_24620 [archaeon]
MNMLRDKHIHIHIHILSSLFVLAWISSTPIFFVSSVCLHYSYQPTHIVHTTNIMETYTYTY